jgi:hypothetical protein
MLYVLQYKIKIGLYVLHFKTNIGLYGLNHKTKIGLYGLHYKTGWTQMLNLAKFTIWSYFNHWLTFFIRIQNIMDALVSLVVIRVGQQNSSSFSFFNSGEQNSYSKVLWQVLLGMHYPNTKLTRLTSFFFQHGNDIMYVVLIWCKYSVGISQISTM